MYIKTCYLLDSITIHIHSPKLHSKVNSGSCHEDRKRKIFVVRVTHTSGQVGGAAFCLDPLPHADSTSGSQMFRLFCITHNVLWLSLFDLCGPRA
jgi:hypothetical protein